MSAGLPTVAAQGDLDGYIERSPVPIFVWEREDGELRLVSMNRVGRALTTDARADAMLGRTAEEVFADDPGMVVAFHRCLDERTEVVRERRTAANGSDEARAAVVTLVWSPPERVLAHVQEVTAERTAAARLRQSEERYRTLIQAANEGVWIVDAQGASIFANHRVMRLLGQATEDVLTGAITDFVAEGDRTRMLAAVQSPRDVRQPFVATFNHHDGHLLTCLVSVAPIGGADSRGATLCVLADMTALKREQDLRLDSERRYRRIVETANEGVWVIDPTGVTTLVNRRMLEMLGVERDDLEGRLFSDFAGDPTTIAAVQRALELDGRPVRAELNLVRSDGTRLDVFVSLSALRDERGELLGGVALVSDITALKREHEELRESQERFAQVFEAAPVGIAFIGAGHLQRGRFLEINATFRDLLGRDESELAELDHAAVTHPADAEREHELAQRLFDGKGRTYEIEKRYVRGDGSHVWAHVRVSLLRDESRRPLYLIAVAADISDRKRAEAIAEQARRTTGAILEHASDAVIEMSHDGTIKEFSPSAVRLFGYEREDAVGREMADLIVPPGLRARQREAVSRYLASGATRVLGARYSTTAMRADGSEFPAEVTIDVVAGSDPPLFIGSVRSVAGEHALVSARQEADERFERSFRDSASGMALVGLDERLIDVNEALCELTGRREVELIGRPWRELLEGDDVAVAVAWQGRALAGAGEALRSRQRLVRSDGWGIPIVLVASLIRRGGQVPVHYLHQYTPVAPVEVGMSAERRGDPLTYRERQVLTLLANGLDGPAIGKKLGLSAETVRSYTQAARAKLGAGTRTEAVALALARGEIVL